MPLWGYGPYDYYSYSGSPSMYSNTLFGRTPAHYGPPSDLLGPLSSPFGHSSSSLGPTFGFPSATTTPPPWSPTFQPLQSSTRLTGQERPFLVKLLNNRIKKCRGCGREFARKVDGSPPDPPLDLIIGHEERWHFTDAQNTPRLGKLQNVYYHPCVACVRVHNADFHGSELKVPADVQVLAAHKKYLSILVTLPRF